MFVIYESSKNQFGRPKKMVYKTLLFSKIKSLESPCFASKACVSKNSILQILRDNFIAFNLPKADSFCSWLTSLKRIFIGAQKLIYFSDSIHEWFVFEKLEASGIHGTRKKRTNFYIQTHFSQNGFHGVQEHHRLH